MSVKDSTRERQRQRESESARESARETQRKKQREDEGERDLIVLVTGSVLHKSIAALSLTRIQKY